MARGSVEDSVSWLLRSAVASVEDLSREVGVWILYGGYAVFYCCSPGVCGVHKRSVGSYVLYLMSVLVFPTMCYTTCKMMRNANPIVYRWIQVRTANDC